ncbi:response regulator [Nibricoccus sp. IMCC34717]|uniref:response regulator n=1 Tax=Nibricoccus sp. IMCC34717 TaxID=3034021 RepID=UPI00384B75FF
MTHTRTPHSGNPLPVAALVSGVAGLACLGAAVWLARTSTTVLPWALAVIGCLLAAAPVVMTFLLAAQSREREKALAREMEIQIENARRAGEQAGNPGRKAAEKERAQLDEARRRLELYGAIHEAISVVVWAIDLDGIFLIREGRCLLDLGLAAGDGVGKHFEEIETIMPGSADSVRRALAGETFAAEHNEGDRWYNTRYAPIRMPDGTLIGACGVTADITSRKRTDALALQEEGVRQATRLKSEFMANMSHELRTPMNGIVGMVGLLGSTGLSDEQQGMLDVIQSSTDNLLRTVNDILDLAKLESGKVKLAEVDFSPHALVFNCLREHGPEAHAKGLELIADVDAAARGTVRGDPDRVRQITANLLSNAVKYTVSGHVLVQVRLQTGADGRGTLCIGISDTGAGIAPERLATLLKPFDGDAATLTRRVGDAGFGLSIAKLVTDLMGGTLSLSSEPGRGTTADVSIPLTFVASAPPLACGLSRRRFLVVDDSEVVRGILALKLSALGAEVDVCASSTQGVTLCLEAAERGSPYTAVLVDRFMPKVDGAAFAALVRAERALAGLPLVLLSPAVEPLEASKRRNFQAELAKPVDDPALLDAISTLLGRSASTASQPADSSEAPRAPRALRILVADDNSVNQAVCKKMLERLGHSAHVVANGREVLAALDQQLFDAIFMDCQMPEVDGYEASLLLRARTDSLSKLWIVAVTANASVADRQKCLDCGMNDFIAKPLRMNVVAEAVERIPA